MNSSRTRQAPAILLASVALLAALLSTVGSATANPSIQSKRAQAQAILTQVHESDAQLEQAIEAYNYANVQLDRLDADLSSNARHLAVARQSLAVAQVHVAKRLRALYINGDGGGAVEILSARRTSTISSAASTWCSASVTRMRRCSEMSRRSARK